ncbi:MAG TPA: SCO family protein [Anaerolineales bacterium]|nr:SCO family protein [Anaerolineae bacterium]HRJ58715.1 SCO family protein [Anaerolineales bacterium]HRK89109.1 SCO family protein [Anaerolineales bacterium]
MDKKLIWMGGGILLVLGVAVILTLVFWQPPSFRGTSFAEPFPPAPEIALTKADGSEFRLSQQQEKIVLLFFGYTSCPDVCPTTMAEMKQVMDALRGDAQHVQVVFVSVDPQRDTADRIQKYANHFHPAFIGLSGSEEELQPIWSGYSIVREVVESDSAFGDIINHTARLFLVDLDGNLRLTYAYQTPVEDIVHDIKLLLE